MSTTTADLTLRVQGKEVFTPAEVPSAPDAQSRTLSAGGASISSKLSSTSVPPITKPPVSLTITLGVGITTIDLTAVSGLSVPPGTRTLDMTGARVALAMLKADPANTNPVNVAPGAANPYPLFGAGNDVNVDKGRVIASGYDGVASQQPLVSGTVKNIDISSGVAGDKLYLDLYFGT
jgi:hypothetical protein